MLGRKDRLKTSDIVFAPNKNSTKQPTNLIVAFILVLLMIVAIPIQDRAMYKASIRAIAKTRCKLEANPNVVDVLNTTKHIGPTANCNNIPNLRPFRIMALLPLKIIDLFF